MQKSTVEHKSYSQQMWKFHDSKYLTQDSALFVIIYDHFLNYTPYVLRILLNLAG